MKQKLTLLMLSVFMTVVYGFSQGGLGTINGTVRDAETKEPIPFCLVAIIQNGSVKGNAETDFDGKFQVNSLEPGQYDVEVRNEAEGYQPTKLEQVRVSANQITFLDKDLNLGKAKAATEIEEVKVVRYKVPLINKDGGASGGTITRDDIAKMPIRSATDVAGLVGGVQVQSNGDVSVRGSRSDATYFYIDGIKVRGSSNLPKSAIEEVNVITGGVPANYGDATGGVIAITTRGPSAKYFGSVEAVSSGFYFKGADKDGYDSKVIGLDKFGYNLIEGMFSGPLLMKKDDNGKKTTPLLGFMLSLNYTDRADSRPVFGGNYRIKKDVRDQILASPLRLAPSGNGTYYNVNFLHADDFEKTDHHMNARNRNVAGQFKIDVKTGPTVNLTFGGSMNYSRRTTAIGNADKINSSSLMNFQNYGLAQDLDWRVFGRITQRFTNDKEGSSSKIKSAYYTLNADFSQQYNTRYDQDYKFDVFKYGHVGTYNITRVPSYEWDNKLSAHVQNGTKDVRVDFTPSETNSELASVTNQYYSLFANNPVDHYENLTQIYAGNGLRNGDGPLSIYSIWNNIGTPYNGFSKEQNNMFRVTGSGSVNIGDHSLTIGFEFEQRTDRQFSSGDNGPMGLWSIARLLQNSHIKELDKNSATITYGTDGNKYISYSQLNSGYASTNNGAFGGAAAEEGDAQSFFDYSLRKKLGWNTGGNEFLNVDGVDPSELSLEMFSADELLNSGDSYVSYYGYDHTGKKVKGNSDINKYFTEFDENGNYKRSVGAFQPTYMSGYIMDKFAFNDLIFNLGLRVDAFDANQSVLKDPYLFYEAKDVRQVKAELAEDQSKEWIKIPSSMGDDYIVYVNDITNPTQINGFRKGNTWYDADGNEVSDSQVLRGAKGIQPYLTDAAKKDDAVGKLNGDGFKDFKTQIYVMPRIAFSFPISDEASFFAHYDILTQRPMDGLRLDPYAYQFTTQRNEIVNNPNLKASQTIDYEIGFQQVLSKSSSVKFSAFYREQRNNVQLVNYFDAYPATYKTYGNRDFGTVKGLTVTYDLRRTGNVRLLLNYTLQFANGTGSDNQSAQGLISAGLPNLRTIFPYNYDQRHNISANIDYRYGEGKDYNGPVINDIKIFENAGLNLTTNVYSGSPYSAQVGITNEGVFQPQATGLEGTTNGSRLPWQYNLELQVDKTFNLKFGKEDKKKETFLNVYVRVINLLNQQVLYDVYRATGNWNDDGYLAAASSQTSIQNQMDEQAFRDYYTMKIQNGFNLASPRQIRLGVKFDF